MCEYGGFKMSNLTMEDKFTYIKELDKLYKEKNKQHWNEENSMYFTNN